MFSYDTTDPVTGDRVTLTFPEGTKAGEASWRVRRYQQAASLIRELRAQQLHASADAVAGLREWEWAQPAEK